MTTLLQLAVYGIQFGFGLLVFLFLLRFLLQLVRAHFHNPISQTVYRATRIPVAALARVAPTMGRFNTASLLLALCCEWLAIAATLTLAGLELPGARLLLWGVLGAAALLVNFYFYGIFVLVILSWIAPHTGHPAASLLAQLVEPVMTPARRLLPPLGGLDLSPMLVLFVLGGLRILLRNLAVGAGLIGGAVPGL